MNLLSNEIIVENEIIDTKFFVCGIDISEELYLQLEDELYNEETEGSSIIRLKTIDGVISEDYVIKF